MVPTAVEGVPIVPLVAPVSATLNVSLGSTVVSPITFTVMGPLVAPGAMMIALVAA